MCGIAGYLGPRPADAEDLARRLSGALAHRGPDSEGTRVLDLKSGRCLALAHRRLSIIDLSRAADQPMEDPETGDLLVVNGEIYNYKELRGSLAGRFTTESDTEVLLKGLAAGPGFIDKARGMFAFAFWDSSRAELTLAVDPMGIKPLYYARTEGGLVFASEVRALLSSGLVDRAPEPAALEGVLAYGAVQAPLTAIKGVRALLPGERLVARVDGSVRGPETYWRPPFGETESSPGAEEAVEAVREAFTRAVRSHLVSDVPVGAFLSGGVDSGALAAAAGGELKTFSVVFSEGEFSEAPYSRALAEKLGLDHTELKLSGEDCLAGLPGALDAMDQPTLDGVNVYLLSRAVRGQGIKTAFTGQGGDELFGGYDTFRLVPKAHAARSSLRFIPGLLWRAAGAAWSFGGSAGRPYRDKIGQFLAGEGDILSIYLLRRQLFPPGFRRKLLADAGGADEGLPGGAAELLRGACEGLDPVNAVSLLDMRTYLANTLLRDGDFMSMAHGLEVRVPFLDRDLVELVARLPGALKLDPELPKPLLLRAAGAAIPREVWRRPKRGFVLPWPRWLKGPLRRFVDEALRDSSAFGKLEMDNAPALDLWKKFLEGGGSALWSRVWALAALREWAVRNL